MRIEVKYRLGHANRHVPAQVVYDRITRIKNKQRGHLAPMDLVNDARPENAPLHPAFEWDNDIAAEAHREEQARGLIRSVFTIEYDDDGVETRRTEPFFVSVARPYDDGGPSYMPVLDAMRDPEVRASVVETAKAQLEGWVRRNRNIEELAHLVATIQTELRKPLRPARKVKKRPRAAATV